MAEAELGTKKKVELHAGDDAVGVRERNIGGGLAAMHGNAAHIDLPAKWRGMDAGDFDPASSDALYFCDEAAANQGLEGIGVDVNEQAEEREQESRNEEEEIFPPAAKNGPG